MSIRRHRCLILPTRGKKIITVHDVFFMDFPSRAGKEAGGAFFRRAVGDLQRCDGIITSSSYTRGELVARFDVRPEKVRVIHPGLDRRFLEDVSAGELENYRTAHFLPASFLLFVGAQEPRKNLPRLIQALKIVHLHGDGIPLVLAGPRGGDTETIRATAARLGLEQSVIMMGYLPADDLPKLYRLATALVFPSLCEGFGLPLVEAMAAGLPVAAAKNSAMPEVAGDSAVYFPAEDTEAMAGKIRFILEDAGLRAALAAGGRKRARELYLGESRRRDPGVLSGVRGSPLRKEHGMKIAADGFELGRDARGVGRVILNFLPLLAGLLPEDEFLVYTKEAAVRSRLQGVSEVVLPWQGGYLRWLNGPLHRALRKDRPDIFLAANYVLPLFYSGTAVLIEHDISAVTHPEWYPRKFAVSRKLVVRRSLARAAAVIVPSEFTRREILAHFNVPEAKIKTIGWGVEESFRPQPGELVDRWKRDKGFAGKRLVGFLGSIFRRRHVPELIRAAGRLRREMPDLAVHLVGENLGGLDQAELDEIRALPWVRWDARLHEEDLAVFYSSLDVFAYLSEYERSGSRPWKPWPVARRPSSWGGRLSAKSSGTWP